MTQSQHTPGPWYVSLNGHETFVYGSDGFPIINTMQALRNISTCEANARLIAAAPDLLEALEIMRNLIDDAEPEDIAFVDAVIAKARGQQ